MNDLEKKEFCTHLSMHPQPIIILIAPQMGENIGTATRAMLNCGLCHLRVVSPRDGWPNDRAIATSSGALELMPEVKIFDSTAEAVADCQVVYATTARARDLVKPVMSARYASLDMKSHAAAGIQTAILFGPERAGLSNDDIDYAHHLITIPLNPAFSSLNLAQAVLILSYEWAQLKFAEGESGYALPTGKSHPAPAGEFDHFFNRLDASLITAQFYRTPELKETTTRNLRAFLQRAQPTSQEINTLHGVLTALAKGTDSK